MKAADLQAQYNKTYGKGTATRGVTVYQSLRLPTGIFEFDLGSGGGFPMGKISEVFGPESSGKTNLMLNACGQAQLLYPGSTAAIFDAEGGLEGKWMGNFVNPDQTLVLRPDYAEAVVDMAEKLIEADDVSVVAVDSIAALVATAELEKSAEGQIMGGNSIVVQKLIRKLVAALNRANKAYENGTRPIPAPAVILINQIRHQIGVMFGSPEKTPGGFAPKFAAALRVRTYGRNIMDKKISDTMPIIKQTDAVIQKWKVPIVGNTIKYDMVTVAHKGLKVGETQAWNLVEKTLQSMGHLGKGPNGKGWVMFGEAYPTLLACREKFNADSEFRSKLLMFLIEQALDAEDSVILVEGELAEGDVEDPEA